MIPKIPKRAVKKFFSRKRIDYRTWKRKSLVELQSMMTRLPARPPIWKKLKKHQRVCLLLGATKERFCFWNDTGTGKTLLSLSLVLYFRKIGLSHCNLVLVPNKVNKYEWRNDVAKHSPNTKVLILEGSTENKWRSLERTRAPIVIETYGGFVHLLCDLVKDKRKGKKEKKRKRMAPDMRRVKRLCSIINGLYMDESIMVVRKNRFGSMMHRLCKAVGKRVDICFALNGTPFGRDPTDLWGQVHIVDNGYTLGETLGLFRAAFFTAKENYFGGATYTFKQSMRAKLYELQANIAIRYTANAADLPKVIPDVKEVSLPEDAQAYYDRAKQAVIAAHGNYQEMKNAFLRMRQVSSGFVGYYNDEDGSKAQYVFDEKPKLDALLSYIESVYLEYKVVVFHEFTFSGNLIETELKKLRIGCVRLSGKTKNHDDVLDRFAHDPKCRVILLQNAAGGYGLDRVKVAKYGLYYESPVGTVLRKQTTRRVERQYSDHEKVFIVDFVTRGTVDQQMLDAHREGFDLFEAIVEGKKRPR